MKIIKSTISADLTTILEDLMLKSGALSIEFATLEGQNYHDRFSNRLEMTVYANDSSVGKIIKNAIGYIRTSRKYGGNLCIHSISPVPS